MSPNMTGRVVLADAEWWVTVKSKLIEQYATCDHGPNCSCLVALYCSGSASKPGFEAALAFSRSKPTRQPGLVPGLDPPRLRLLCKMLKLIILPLVVREANLNNIWSSS
jgi:hypothetical protein